ncbi:MAG: 6-phosphofructokinase [Oscillospiraceae bacterium]
MNNVMIGLSGGPSVAINASLAGVMQCASRQKNMGKIYGAKNGIKGVLDNKIIDLTNYCDEKNIEILKQTPAMALGSCRYKVKEEDYKKIIVVLQKYEIGYFFYIGGNDSMDTVLKLDNYCKQNNIDIKVVGIPKTVDNDLPVTDHTPGYGSAAKYLYHTVSEVYRDSIIYPMKNVVIIEAMGRDSGWLTLAAGLPRVLGKGYPHIVALPEVPFDEIKFIEDVKTMLEEQDLILCVVSEGIKDKDGDYIGSSTKNGKVDTFGHTYLSGVGKYLEMLVNEKIGCKVRSIELSVLQRCASHLASKTDIDEAFLIGQKGVSAALEGNSGITMTYIRESGADYKIKIMTTDVDNIANKRKDIPEEWFNLDDENVRKQIKEYLLPLISGNITQALDETGLPVYIDIK